MDVLVLIDKLDDLVHNAKPVPLTDQVRVDKEEIYDILDQMRATIPEEIKQARWIVKERQEMLAEAKREAERIVKEARERQERLVSEEEITKQAERAAEDIIEDARAREREIRLGAEDYADEILNTLEVNLSKFIAAVQRGRDRLAGKDEPAEVSVRPDARRGQVTAESMSGAIAGPEQDPVIEVLETDITTLEVDAIANAANTELLHGGGVAGAISRAGGPVVDHQSRERAPIGLGEAVETAGGSMPCRWVIHAATMELGGPTSAEIIRRATASTLRRADELGAKSLALVAFGTGVGGFPLSAAAQIEVEEVRKHLEAGSGLERIVFAVRGEAAREAFHQALAAAHSDVVNPEQG